MSTGDTRSVVKASALRKVYPGSETPAVDDISIEVKAGDVLGLLGPNGAGKTTTISMLSTLLKPTSGSVEVCGFDLQRDAKKIRQKIGLVPQDIALYPILTGRENLRYFGKLYGLAGDALDARVEAELESVGLTAQADRRIETYSGGMKRRINLAVGLLHEPELIFLDEPTVGIDAQSRGRIMEVLKGLRDSGVTMIYTTHYMEEAQQLCSRIDIIDLGKIVASGTYDELLTAHPSCESLDDIFLHLTGRALRD